MKRRPVAIIGDYACTNIWFPIHLPGGFLGPRNEGAPLFVPARHGDVLYFIANQVINALPLIYAQHDGPVLNIIERQVEEGRCAIFMNGKMVALMLKEREDLEWVEEADVDELKHLRTVVLDDINFFDEKEKEGQQEEEEVQWVQGIMTKIQEAAREMCLLIRGVVPHEFLAPLRPRGLLVGGDGKYEDALRELTSVDPIFFQNTEHLILVNGEEEEARIVAEMLKSMPRLRYIFLQGGAPMLRCWLH